MKKEICVAIMVLILFVCNVSPTTAQTTEPEDCPNKCNDDYNRCMGYAERNRSWGE